MNFFTLVVYGNVVDGFLSLDSLVNFRRLMTMGAYGRIDNLNGTPTSGRKMVERDVWELLVKTGKPGLWLAARSQEILGLECGEIIVSDWDGIDPLGTSLLQFEKTQEWMRTRDWIACLIEDHGLQSLSGGQSTTTYQQKLDEALGSLFESLGDETVVAVLLRRQLDLSGFILAAPFAEPVGEVLNASVNDFAATLLHLLGFIPGEPSGGQLILRRTEDSDHLGATLSQDEEAILRERLGGLGYL